MERGNLAIDGRQSAVFVFENLIATCAHGKTEKGLIRLRRFDAALDLWHFDYRVLDYMHGLMSRYGVPVEVLTWHPHGFARVLADRLWDHDLPVRDVYAGDYENVSQQIAIDGSVSIVYDADKHHRWGYGWKCRELDFGTY